MYFRQSCTVKSIVQSQITMFLQKSKLFSLDNDTCITYLPLILYFSQKSKHKITSRNKKDRCSIEYGVLFINSNMVCADPTVHLYSGPISTTVFLTKNNTKFLTNVSSVRIRETINVQRHSTSLQDSCWQQGCSCSRRCSMTASRRSCTSRWTRTAIRTSAATRVSTANCGPTTTTGTDGRSWRAASRSSRPRRQPCSPSPRTSGGWRTASSTRPSTGNRRRTRHRRCPETNRPSVPPTGAPTRRIPPRPPTRRPGPIVVRRRRQHLRRPTANLRGARTALTAPIRM